MDFSQTSLGNNGLNRIRGSKSPHAIPLQCDGMYNNPLYSEIAEDVTPKRQIIKMVTRNKICSKHGHLLDESDDNHSCRPGM